MIGIAALGMLAFAPRQRQLGPLGLLARRLAEADIEIVCLHRPDSASLCVKIGREIEAQRQGEEFPGGAGEREKGRRG